MKLDLSYCDDVPTVIKQLKNNADSKSITQLTFEGCHIGAPIYKNKLDPLFSEIKQKEALSDINFTYNSLDHLSIDTLYKLIDNIPDNAKVCLDQNHLNDASFYTLNELLNPNLDSNAKTPEQKTIYLFSSNNKDAKIPEQETKKEAFNNHLNTLFTKLSNKNITLYNDERGAYENDKQLVEAFNLFKEAQEKRQSPQSPQHITYNYEHKKSPSSDSSTTDSPFSKR